MPLLSTLGAGSARGFGGIIAAGGTPWTFDAAKFNGGLGTNGQFYQGPDDEYFTRGVVFNNDGTQMVVLNSTPTGFGRGYLDSYALDIPYVVSSGTRTQRVQIESTTVLSGLRVNDDGTKFYYAISTTNLRYANLTTGWDVSTYTAGTLSDTSLRPSSVNSNSAVGLFNDSGDVYYAFPLTGTSIKVFTLSSPWDWSAGNVTAGTDITTISGQGFSNLRYVNFSHDGSVLYITDDANVFTAVDVTTPFDLTTIDWSSKTLNKNYGTNIYSAGSEPMGISYFGVGSTSSSTRIVSCGFGLSSAISNSGPSAADVVNFDIEVPSNLYNPPTSLVSSANPWYGTFTTFSAQFNSDGSNLIIGRHRDPGTPEYFDMYNESLSVNYDISSSSYTTSRSSMVGISLPSNTRVQSFRFTEDGYQGIFVGNYDLNYVISYSTPFDPSTRTAATLFKRNDTRFSAIQTAESLMFNDTKDEVTFAVGGLSTLSTIKYNMTPGLYTVPLGTPGDITTADTSGLGRCAFELSSYSTIASDNCGLEFDNTGSTYATFRTAGNLGVTFDSGVNYGVGSVNYNVTGAGSLFPNYNVCAIDYQASNSGRGPKSFSFNNDGTKAYVLATDTNSIRTFSLTTPYDLSDIKNNVTGYSAMPKNLWRRNDLDLGLTDSFTMNPTGTKIYRIRGVSGSGSSGVYEYTLSTPWDLSSSATNASSSLAVEGGFRGDIAWGDSGNYFYRLSNKGNNQLERYAASTPYDLGSCGSTPDKTFVFGTPSVGLGTKMDKMFFKPDGTSVFMYALSTTSNGEYIFQWDMSTPWDPSTIGSTTTPNASVTLGLVNDDWAAGIHFTSDGSQLVVAQQTRWYKYNLGTNWDLSTVNQSTGVETYRTVQLPMPNDCENGLFISPDETKIFTGSSRDFVIRSDFGTPLDFSTISNDGGPDCWYYLNSENIGGIPYTIGWQNNEFRWKPDGTSIYIYSTIPGSSNWPVSYDQTNTGPNISQFNLSTAWDLTTATYAGFGQTTTALNSQSWSFDISSNGEHVIIGYLGLWMGTMSTPWDITTLGTVSEQLVDGFTWKERGFLDNAPSAVRWHPNNGSAIYTRGESGLDEMYTHKMTLTTPYDPTTAVGAVEGTAKFQEALPTDTIYGSWPSNSQFPGYQCFQFQDNGNYMYFLESTTDDTTTNSGNPPGKNIRAFSLSTPYDVTTATEMTSFPIAQGSSPPSSNDFLNGQNERGVAYFDWHPNGKKFIYTNGFLIGEYKV